MFLRRRVPENGPLKAAVIGAGVFGHHHATKYKVFAGKGVELLAVADPNPDMRAKAKAHHGCQVVADWRELLGKVDLVSICSPAVTHAEKQVELTGSYIKRAVRQDGLITDGPSQVVVIDRAMIERSGAQDLRQLLVQQRVGR